MDHGGVRDAPLDIAGGLIRWALQPRVWHELNGDHISRGVDLLELSADQFLDVVYFSMIQRLKPDDEGNTTAARQELDDGLAVVRWQVPGGGNKYAEAEIEPGAPSWWAGDEEASQGSLAAMRAMGANI